MHNKCYCAPLGRPPKQTDSQLIEQRRKAIGERDLRHNKTNIPREQHQGQVLRCRKVMDRSLLFRKETQEDS